MRSLFDQLKRGLGSRTMKGSAVVMGGNGVSMGLAIVFTVLAARWLGPSDWGWVAGVGNLETILVAVGELGLGAGVLKFISRRREEGAGEEARKMLSAIMVGRCLSALVLVVLLVLVAGPLANLIFGVRRPELVFFAALGLAGFLLLDFQITVLEAEQRWVTAAGFYILSNALRLAWLVTIAALGWLGLWSVMAVFCGSALLAFFVSLIWRRVRFDVARDWKERLVGLVGFSGWMAVNKVVSTVNGRIDVLMLLPLAGAYETGIYSAANRLALGVPIILGGLATVLAQRFASFGEKGQVGVLLKKAVILAGLVCGGLLVGVAVSGWMVGWFGPEYRAALPVLRWMLLAFIPFVMATPAVNALIYGFDRQKVMALVAVGQLPLVVFFNWFLIPTMGVMAPVLTMGVVNLSTMMVAYYLVFREVGK